MTLQQAISNSINLHTELRQAGMSSTQALNFIIVPMEEKNLKECLDRLTVDQLDRLVYTLRENLYHVGRKKKTPYQVAGIIPYKGDMYVTMVDSALGIDSLYLDLIELPQQLTDDILKTISNIL
jgi:hypothetical protein